MGTKDEKLVMRVTIRAQEFPDFFRELGAMTAHKQRVNVMTRLAYFGWLLERNGLRIGAATPNNESAHQNEKLVELTDAPLVGDWLSDLGGSDEPEEHADGSTAT